MENKAKTLHTIAIVTYTKFSFFPLCIPGIPSGKSPLFTKLISEQRLLIKATKIEKLLHGFT